MRNRLSGPAKRTKDWTPGEISKLRKMYPMNSNDFIAGQLNRSVSSVQYKASSLGLRKSKEYLALIRDNRS